MATNQRRWSPEEKQFMVDHYLTTPVVELSRILNRSEYSINNYAHKRGWKKDRSRPRPTIVVPTGTESRDALGYILVKMDGIGAWKLKHRMIWEQHYGPIPPKHFVSFKDKNKSNCDISNLELFTGKEFLAKNSLHNMPEEVKGLYHSIGVLNKLINKRRKDDGK